MSVYHKLLVLLLLVFGYTGLMAQVGEFSVLNIPKELTIDAGSVIRYKSQEFTIHSPGEAEMEEKFVITILHESHRQYAYFIEHFDSFSKLGGIKINLYDRNGKLIKRVPKSDIHETSLFAGSGVFDDAKHKVYDPEYHEYPFTIEYVFKRTFKGLLGYPPFRALNGYDMSLQSGKLLVHVPNSMTLRYLEQNVSENLQVSTTDEVTTYTWEFNDVKPIRPEEYDLEFSDLVPMVWLAPTKFVMDDYEGDASSWEELGKWVYSLTQGRDELPEEVKTQVRELVDDTPDVREKIKRVYQYMQNKTRYVNISIGIGGWQPFTAMEVEENGYGDCKALTNYTHALLKAIDIPSYYTVIRSGREVASIKTDFPSQQFNHVILCVPLETDTVWLECTNQNNPFNYLGTSTENRWALLTNDEGGHLVKTPGLGAAGNMRIRRAVVQLDAEGNVLATVDNTYGGMYYDRMMGIYLMEGKYRMKSVRESIHLSHFSLNDQDYQITQNPDELPTLDEHYAIAADRYAKLLGNRIMFDVNFFNTPVDVPSAINKQPSPIELSRAYTTIDSIDFVVSEGYFVKSFPKNDTLVSDFGSCQTKFVLDGQVLHYIRKQLVNKGLFGDDRYGDLREYLKQVNVIDNKKVLLMPVE